MLPSRINSKLPYTVISQILLVREPKTKMFFIRTRPESSQLLGPSPSALQLKVDAGHAMLASVEIPLGSLRAGLAREPWKLWDRDSETRLRNRQAICGWLCEHKRLDDATAQLCGSA